MFLKTCLNCNVKYIFYKHCLELCLNGIWLKFNFLYLIFFLFLDYFDILI